MTEREHEAVAQRAFRAHVDAAAFREERRRRAAEHARRREFERALSAGGERFHLPGQCRACGAAAGFDGDHAGGYAQDGVLQPNWREQLRCRACGLMNRQRAAVHLLRARLRDDGTVEHLVPPEYHGDPVRQAGCLAFHTFGWELLEEMRAAGFADVAAWQAWSPACGYLGPAVFLSLGRRPAAGSA